MQDDNPPADSRPSLERRLATILVADVFGYSRMMQVNEERTVKIFRGHREIFDELIRQHHGRIFNTAGDAVLAEFPSTVESVRCATEIQTALRTRNEHLPEDQRMWFRIGINLGDVIVQGDDLLGDGVNVAARIQTIAEPGGISISGSVYDQIQNKLTLQFISMGERSFKNIVQPIRTFSIAEADGASMPANLKPEQPKGRKLTGIIAAVIALIAVAGGGYWIFQNYEPRRAQEPQQAADLERQSAEAKRRLVEAKANEEQLTAKAQQLQAKLEAEAYQRQAAEAQLRKAKIEAETQEAKAALDRVENEKKRLDQEIKRAAAERRAAELTAQEKKTGRPPDGQAMLPRTAEPQRTANAPAAALSVKDVKAPDRFDGTYEGRLCNEPRSSSQKKMCWDVDLKIEQDKVVATWTHRWTGNSSHMKGRISADGNLSLKLDGWLPDGRSTSGNMTGKRDNNRISASGYWASGLPVTGSWKRVFKDPN
jgi:class 3 adenylate cyclase